mmetsp:Transcript_45545/g.91945  ORF Transcript_45545/g.91945 Transcript_45545/m.91945 type:complete len:300 (-) Transcript_45545:200-1099(-)
MPRQRRVFSSSIINEGKPDISFSPNPRRTSSSPEISLKTQAKTVDKSDNKPPVVDDYLKLMSTEETIAASEYNYGVLMDWNERFETKTSTVITLSTAMIGVLGAIASGLEPSSLKSPSVWVALFAAIGPLIAVIVEISRGTTPVLTPPSRTNIHQPKHSLLFFGTTAQIPAADYHDQLINRTRASYLADLAAQQHQVSSILTIKFSHLSKAYHYLWIAYGTFLPACVVLWAAESNVGSFDVFSEWLLLRYHPGSAAYFFLPPWASSLVGQRLDGAPVSQSAGQPHLETGEQPPSAFSSA